MHAVLACLVRHGDGWNFIMEVRSGKVSQPGEVCFPGGRVEAGEPPVCAALRETREELGLPESAIHILAEADPEHMQNGREIRIFLATLDPEALRELRLSTEEVSSIFYLPLSWLRENQPASFVFSEDEIEDLPVILRGYLAHYDPVYRSTGRTDYWEYSGHGIWGLTARILRKLLCSGALESYR